MNRIVYTEEKKIEEKSIVGIQNISQQGIEDEVSGTTVYYILTVPNNCNYAIKLASKRNEKKLSAITELTTLDDKPIKIIDIGQRDKDRDKDNRDREREWNYKNSHHINNNHQQSNHTSHIFASPSRKKIETLILQLIKRCHSDDASQNSLTLAHDPGTSDDSGRASERLTTSSVAPRDADSSRDRLSDASSRCSSGKGYICDSEGDDDKVFNRIINIEVHTYTYNKNHRAQMYH
ncbi:hypothetical protein Bhyg_11565 [Pseudolycoriella hygida]|uniref:Uncharacterized protein n=1 Tax=Pseudolycoriella hygida TaxID=35572 RepID=A0A9Q0MVN5_9DIPT|nr:hypothetical protein Bhyg_11565 [Pseudolycoriella hygida]